MFKLGKIKFLLIFFLIIYCTPNQEVVSEISQPGPTATVENKLVVSTYEELPDALVRIEVKSTQAELTEDLEIEILEYEGTGSGFFISSDGYIVTNNHVVSGAVAIEVFTQYRSQPYTAKLVGLSECDDLAVLKIDIDNVNYLAFETSEPKLGQEIIAAGFPLGDKEVTFLDGIVSKKQTDGSTSWASIEYAFEHTAEILPGSSGGPIVNDKVKVLGIAYAGNDDRQEFGIPIVVIEDKIQQIINDEFQYSFRANVEQFYGVGLYVYSVDTDSPLKKVGINGGEVITEIKGYSLSGEETLKVFCDSLFVRTPDVGINFVGVSLEDSEKFNVEVSLDGSVSSINSRTSATSSTTTTTTTTTIPKKQFIDLPVPELIEVNTYYGDNVPNEIMELGYLDSNSYSIHLKLKVTSASSYRYLYPSISHLWFTGMERKIYREQRCRAYSFDVKDNNINNQIWTYNFEHIEYFAILNQGVGGEPNSPCLENRSVLALSNIRIDFNVSRNNGYSLEKAIVEYDFDKTIYSCGSSSDYLCNEGDKFLEDSRLQNNIWVGYCGWTKENNACFTSVALNKTNKFQSIPAANNKLNQELYTITGDPSALFYNWKYIPKNTPIFNKEN